MILTNIEATDANFGGRFVYGNFGNLGDVVKYGYLDRSYSTRSDMLSRAIWRFEAVGTHSGKKLFLIRNGANENYALDQNNAQDDSKAPYLGTANASNTYQQWLLYPNTTSGYGSNAVTIICKQSGWNIRPASSGTANDGNLISVDPNAANHTLDRKTFHIFPLIQNYSNANKVYGYTGEFTSTISTLNKGSNLVSQTYNSTASNVHEILVRQPQNVDTVNSQLWTFKDITDSGNLHRSMCAWKILDPKGNAIYLNGGNNVSSSRLYTLSQTNFDINSTNLDQRYNAATQMHFLMYNMAGNGSVFLSCVAYNGSGEGSFRFKLWDVPGGGASTEYMNVYDPNYGGAQQFYITTKTCAVTVQDKSTTGKVLSTPYNNTGLYHNVKYNLSGHTGYVLQSGSTYFISGRQNGDSTTTYTTSISITRTWKPMDYTIKYNANDGSDRFITSSHNYESAGNLTQNTFTKSNTLNFDLGGGKGTSVSTYNHTFLGWATAANSSSANYNDKASAQIVPSGDGGTINLYAVWGNPTQTLPTPTRDGYHFAGWAETNTLTDSTPFVSSVTNPGGDKNYYAFYVGLGDDTSLLPENGISAVPKVYHYNTAQNVALEITYDWDRIGANGSSDIQNDGSQYIVTDADKNHAIKCVITSKFVNSQFGSKEFPITVISALYVGDTLVDTDVIGDQSNSHYANKDGCFDDAILVNGGIIEAGQTVEFTFEGFDAGFDGVASQVIFGNAFNGANYTYKVYGYLGTDKVLLFTNSADGRNGIFASNKESKVGKQGIAFNSYVIEITNNSETEAINVSVNDVSILNLPKVYKLNNLDDKKGYKPLFLVGKNFSETTCRTEQDGVEYFYAGDVLRILIPVDNGNKLTAGSYIVINGEKVFPTCAVPEMHEDGKYYVSFDYTNYYECLVRGNGLNDNDLKLIGFSAQAPADVTISVKIKQKSNTESHGLNFGPLGAKIKPDTTQIRFGSVWYFDDFATQNSWSRDDKKGTYILQLKNILKETEGNDFYNYLMEKDPAFVAKWRSKIDEDRYIVNNIVNDKGVELITRYLNDFINEWNAERKTSSTTDENGQKIEGKADMMSFGGAEIVSDAKYYYYKTDKDGKNFLEYSALMSVPTGFENRQLIYIPYTSFVADWDYGYLAPKSKYQDNIYLYQAPEAVYTHAELIQASQAK